MESTERISTGDLIITKTGKLGAVTAVVPRSTPEVVAAYERGERVILVRTDHVEYRSVRGCQPFGPTRRANVADITLCTPEKGA